MRLGHVGPGTEAKKRSMMAYSWASLLHRRDGSGSGSGSGDGGVGMGGEFMAG